jgi:hypothetical protein
MPAAPARPFPTSRIRPSLRPAVVTSRCSVARMRAEDHAKAQTVQRRAAAQLWETRWPTPRRAAHRLDGALAPGSARAHDDERFGMVNDDGKPLRTRRCSDSWRRGESARRPKNSNAGAAPRAAPASCLVKLAVAERFELSEVLPSRAFEARSLGRSDTPPRGRLPDSTRAVPIERRNHRHPAPRLIRRDGSGRSPPAVDHSRRPRCRS